MGLTGRFNLRKTFSGRIILQVEEGKEELLGLSCERTEAPPALARRHDDGFGGCGTAPPDGYAGSDVQSVFPSCDQNATSTGT